MQSSDSTNHDSRGPRDLHGVLRFSSVIVAIAFNVATAFLTYFRYHEVTPGSEFRDMGFPALCLIIGGLSVFTALFMGVLLACYGYWREALIGLVLSCLPFWVGRWMAAAMMHAIGFNNAGP